MSYLELQSVSYALADGRPLLRDVSFRVSSHERVALIGANGAGKTTLFKIVLGEIVPQKGSVVRSGSVGIMRQFVDSGTVEGLLLSVAPPQLRETAKRLHRAERAASATSETQL